MSNETGLSWIKEILIRIIKIFIIIYLMAMFYIAMDWLKVLTNEKETKYAIVYWSKVEQNWKPSDRLKARLDKSIELLNSKKVERIIVSWWLWDNWFKEWDVMRMYLLNNWVKIPRVIVDNFWINTLKTSKNSLVLINDRWDFPNVWIIWVSQFFHCSRVKLSLKKAGFWNVYCASPEYFEFRDIYSLLREVPAYIKYIFI